jgi:YD repeat-containing protein
VNRLTSATKPRSGTTSYTYDADGNVLSKADARSITITYAYDALNRVEYKTYSDGTPTAGFFYDQAPSSWPAWSGVSFGKPGENRGKPENRGRSPRFQVSQLRRIRHPSDSRHGPLRYQKTW